MQANIESGGKDASLAVVIHQGRLYRRDDFDSGWSRWECGRIVQLRAEVDAHIAVSGSWATSESGARS